MGRTYTHLGYSVTINDDRSIDVRPGDWISKYAQAIYGDPHAHWNRFQKKVGEGSYAPLDDPNTIVVGDKVYHPGPLPGEVEWPPQDSERHVEAGQLEKWLKWLFELANPVTEWSLTGSGGVELSAFVFAGNFFWIGAQRKRDREETWFYGAGAGGALGPESIAGSLTMSNSDFPSDGFFAKLPIAGTRLNRDEICGTYLVVDFGLGVGLGGGCALMLFGFKFPPIYVLSNMIRYFRGDELLYPRHLLPMGFLFMKGLTATTPALGLSMKSGLMHRKECVPVGV